MKRNGSTSTIEVTDGSQVPWQKVTDYRALRTWIGVIAVSLVFVVYFGNWLIFTPHVAACLVPGGHLPDSLSGFYYTHMRNVFVGAMAAMGVVLGAYRGYEPRDNWFTNVAGIAAIGIAMFPTTVPGGDVMSASNPCGPTALVVYNPSTNAKALGYVHAFWLAVLFAMVFFMLLIQFTQSDSLDPGKGKKQRNRFYRICAWAILADALFVGAMTLVTHFNSSAWQGSSWLMYAEAFAFVVFGIAWFVKGRQGLWRFMRDVTTDASQLLT